VRVLEQAQEREREPELRRLPEWRQVPVRVLPERGPEPGRSPILSPPSTPELRR